MLNKLVLYSLLIPLISILLVEILNRTKPKHPNAGLSTEELVRKFGYPIENHEVATEDGYLLTLHRIPHGRVNKFAKRGSILIMHGFAHSSFNYVNSGPEKCLSLLLAEKGYDVWIGNARGNTFSRKHKILDPDKDPAFWEFSIHEIGIYDVPASIDYILNTTGEQSLQYIGHSQGTIVFFIMGSERNEYIKKVRLMTALSPAIYVKDPPSPPFRFISSYWKKIDKILNYLEVKEYLAKDSVFAWLLSTTCNENSIFSNVCLHVLFQLFGYSYDGMDRNTLSLEFSQTPAGVSVKQMIHVFQLVMSGEFQNYDYGPEGNMVRYGQEIPQRYNISNITAPIAIYYSSNDWAVNIKNMARIVNELPNVVKTYQVPSTTFNHYDFLIAKDVVTLLYDAVIEEIMKY